MVLIRMAIFFPLAIIVWVLLWASTGITIIHVIGIWWFSDTDLGKSLIMLDRVCVSLLQRNEHILRIYLIGNITFSQRPLLILLASINPTWMMGHFTLLPSIRIECIVPPKWILGWFKVIDLCERFLCTFF